MDVTATLSVAVAQASVDATVTSLIKIPAADVATTVRFAGRWNKDPIPFGVLNQAARGTNLTHKREAYGFLQNHSGIC